MCIVSNKLLEFMKDTEQASACTRVSAGIVCAIIYRRVFFTFVQKAFGYVKLWLQLP